MALTPQSYQFLNQLNTLRYIDASTGPDGAQGVTAYWLVPTGEWHQGSRLSHDVVEDLGKQDYNKTTVEGVEYYLVPEESTNTPGILSHYAQRTGVAELQNPSSGGVNRVRETFVDNAAHATADPQGVEKYVKDNDSWEEARKKRSEEDERVLNQVTQSPAREPAEGKLVTGDASEKESSTRGSGGHTKSAPKPAQDNK